MRERCYARRYAHVVPQCLVDSPSAKWWFDWEASGGKPDDLVMHIERHADFDGLAVGWGIGNKKASVEECGEACRAHRRNPQGGETGLIGGGGHTLREEYIGAQTLYV